MLGLFSETQARVKWEDKEVFIFRVSKQNPPGKFKGTYSPQHLELKRPVQTHPIPGNEPINKQTNAHSCVDRQEQKSLVNSQIASLRVSVIDTSADSTLLLCTFLMVQTALGTIGLKGKEERTN